MARPSSHRVAVLRGTLETLYCFFLFRIRDFHSLWLLIPKHFSIKRNNFESPKPFQINLKVWTSPLSLAATNGIPIKRSLFLRVLRCVSSPGSPTRLKVGSTQSEERVGFPIRKPPVGNDCMTTHRRFRSLAYVLPRLLVPRHSPFAFIIPKPCILFPSYFCLHDS